MIMEADSKFHRRAHTKLTAIDADQHLYVT